MKEPIIEIKNLNFTYNRGKGNEYQALSNINLNIFPEEYVIIFGPSGCGKSTLLNVIAGLETADSGEARALAHDLMHLSKKDFAYYHRYELGIIFQAYNLIPSLTVLENVALPQIFINRNRSKREDHARTLLERFGIANHADKIPTELSGGQQQRIGIARSIVNNPQIVIADEPMGNLDSTSAKNVLEILRELNEEENKTIILVTHDPEILFVADRVIYVKDGAIIKEEVNSTKVKKGKVKAEVPRSPSKELNEMMKIYHTMDDSQINVLIMPYKAKVLVNRFSSRLSAEEAGKFEDLLQRKMLGTLTDEEFADNLSRSFVDGGVGLSRKTAQKVVARVNDVIGIAQYIYQDYHQKPNASGKHDLITNKEKADAVTQYLLRTCYHGQVGAMNEIKMSRLKQAVIERVMTDLPKSDFYNYLDQSFKDSGVGLNSRTARAITEELELILVVGYGFKLKKDIKSDK